MKYLNRLFVLSIISATLSLSCNAGNKAENNAGLINNLAKKLNSSKVILDVSKTSEVLQGDFNGDGLDDLAAVFLPVSDIKDTDRLKVIKLWNYPGQVSSGKFHKSIVIFHGSKSGWLSDATQSFVLLDTTAALETPSFELLLSRVGDKDYRNHASYLPVKLKSDLIIVPTEAGIDTYIYWDKNSYKLFEPEEIP